MHHRHKYFITFNADNGAIIISDALKEKGIAAKLDITDNMKIEIFPENIPYLKYHNEKYNSKLSNNNL